MNGSVSLGEGSSSSASQKKSEMSSAAAASSSTSCSNGYGYTPEVNSGIQVRKIDDKMGYGVFATRSFKKGEEVLTDMPIVTCQFAWNQMYKYEACDHCMRALETAEENVRRLTQNPTFELPFPDCCETKKSLQVACDECLVKYCSVECKEKAFDEYHRILCFHSENPPATVTRLVEFWRAMHYPPETANIMLLVRLLVKLHLDSDKSLLQRIQNFCQASANEEHDLVHKVLGDEYSLQVNTLRELVTAVVNFPNIQEWLTPEGFLKLFVLIGRNSQGVGTSSFATYVTNVEKLELPPDEKKAVLDTIDHIYEVMDSVVGHFMDNEGVALYPLQSWANHSCVPNCEVKFPDKNHRVGLFATRDIPEGEEIKISYLDLADLSRSRYSRNKYLKEHYLFECDCPKCVEQINDEECTTDSDEDMVDDDEDADSDMSES